MNIVKSKIIEFVGVEKLEFKDIEFQAGDDDVVINLAYSTISNGTERANFMGDRNIGANIPYDPDPTPGGIFPRRLGYSGSGVIEWVGKNVKNVKIGDRVCAVGGFHAKHLVLNKNAVFKIWDNVSLQDAAIANIATFSLAGVRKTELEIGESGMVVGLGILGINAVQIMHACGAYPVIAVDTNAQRRETALEYGADFAFDPTDPEFFENIKKATEGRMINAAVEVTGSGAALNTTLDCMAELGRVSLLGCTRDPNFTIDYYRKVHYTGVKIIGAHNHARPASSFRDYWTTADDINTLVRLKGSGRIKLDALVSEVHSPLEAEEIYDRLSHDKNFPICVQFDWSDIK